jgi:hypothetical protein
MPYNETRVVMSGTDPLMFLNLSGVGLAQKLLDVLPPRRFGWTLNGLCCC